MLRPIDNSCYDAGFPDPLERNGTVHNREGLSALGESGLPYRGGRVSYSPPDPRERKKSTNLSKTERAREIKKALALVARALPSVHPAHGALDTIRELTANLPGEAA